MIKDLIQKDFQEVFPSIIGEGENKLSIDDLMETSNSLLYKELQLMKESINPTEVAGLVSFIELMEISEIDIEYDSNTHYKLKRLAEKYPDHDSFRFFLYRYLLSTSYDNEENSLENLTRLINRIITDPLFALTDFITVSGFGDLILSLINVSEPLLTTLQDAVSRFPNKIILLWITAHLFRVQGNYEEAIRYNLLFLDKLKEMKKKVSKVKFDLDFVDADAEQMVCFQIADLLYDTGNFTEAIIFCNRILDQHKRKPFSESTSFYLYDTLIIRIRIHIASNDKSAFNKDFAELLKVISEEDLQGNYKDILIYAEQLKN